MVKRLTECAAGVVAYAVVMAKPRKVTAGELFTFPTGPDGWGACQVLHVLGRQVEVLCLDHRSDAQPTRETVCLKPLVRDRYAYTGRPARHFVDDALPDDFVSLGVAPPVMPVKPSAAYAHWDALRREAVYEHRWRRLPQAVRDAYKAARPAATVTLPLAEGPHALTEGQAALRLAFGPAPSPEPGWLWAGDGTRFDWSCLDALPRLAHLGVSGEAPGALPWVVSHPLVQHLTWWGAGDTLDLSGLDLVHLELGHPSPARVVLPTGLRALHLVLDAARPVTVVAAGGGAGITLTAHVRDAADLAALQGLDAVGGLCLQDVVSLDLRALGRFTALRSLQLGGAAGRVTHSAALAAHRGLRELRVQACVSVDASSMPPLSAWPALQTLRVAGASAEETAALRAHWGRDRRVSLVGALDAAAVFAQADIPMQRWLPSVQRAHLCSAYGRAAAAVAKPGLTEAKARRALKGFADAVAQWGAAFDAAQRCDLNAAWQRLTDKAAEQLPEVALGALPGGG